MKYDMLEPLSDLNASLDLLTSVFAPIYTENWAQNRAKLFGNPAFDMNVNVFAHMWFSKAMRIFVAYGDDGKAAGYLLGMVFRPLTHEASIFQIEDWYARNGNHDIICGLFEYMQEALRFIGIDELWISHDQHEALPVLDSMWRRQGSTIIDRYVK